MAATLGSVWPSMVLALGSPPSSIHCFSTETLPRAVAVRMCFGSADMFGAAAMALAAVGRLRCSRLYRWLGGPSAVGSRERRQGRSESSLENAKSV